eukprot:TRINITY_DN8780_c2_g1_i3.p1 TRINITY_DN8780_c2_g1~~TRINITY_DN8780_c2_g1_i3.p1  ORF type:complete len:527 (+),score=103.58 TRINITY_DN8780_c2_g1_i3:147-1727(+)
MMMMKKMRARVRVILSLSLLVLLSSSSPSLFSFGAPPPLGANLDGVVDWSRSFQFVDVIKSSRYPFGSPQAPWDGSSKMDANGWPLGDFGVVISTAEIHVGDNYKVSYLGHPCTIEGAASTATVANMQYNAATGMTTCDLNVPDTQTQLMLKFTNTSGGVKQLSIRRSGYGPNDVFTKPFITQLQRFAGPLRFMDWARTNGSPVGNWSSRALPTNAQYTGDNGVPWEVCIAVCNTLNKDMWINVPAMAMTLANGDDYITELAKLFQKNLNGNLNLYLEYSNEVWNWGFSQSHWNLNEAQIEVKAGKSPLNYNNDNNIYYWAYRRVALCLMQISDTFAQVFGKEAINKRIRPVLAGQVVNPIVIGVGLEMIQAVYGPPSSFFFAIAGAPYFNLGQADQRTNLTRDDVINALNATIQSIKSSQWLVDHGKMAKNYSLEFFSYEGGSDTFRPNNIAAKSAASLDPRMKTLCVDYLTNGWFSRGYGVFNWFTAGATAYDTQYGTWGLTYDAMVLDTPKIQAVNQVLGIQN